MLFMAYFYWYPEDSLTFGFDEAAAAVKAAGFKSVEVLTVNGFETQQL